MNRFLRIRRHLGLTQAALARAIDVTQGNISHYEKGQTVSPAVAVRLIRFAASLGQAVSYEEIYGRAEPGAASDSESANDSNDEAVDRVEGAHA
ncbi:helix-turn-helix domain-containing protein [Achromobacter dolens]|uniref:helix-turn-helix domain-containing protein n=1 Tax=Achromobacter dolens TaxID=1287738 RepID=UPI0022B8D020|nr:helix-turn-helix domain-containing protein [Achromobacter dolens]MCZ8411671.1 helix-turn-helix domain-containing protein [Achromobacter dolens]